MNEPGEVGTATIRAGWVIARQHRMAYDPDLVCGAACLDAEFDHGTRQWVATVRRAPLDGPASVARHLYADAGNFKTWNSVVVAGALPEGDLASLLDACEPGPDSRLFIPAQVGLPEDRGGFAPDADMDTAYFEIDRSSFALTVAPPSVILSARELAARFEMQRGGWDPAVAWGRLMGTDARDEPQDRE